MKLVFSLLILTFTHSLIAYVDIPSAANILKYCIIELLKFITPIPSLSKIDVTYLNVIKKNSSKYRFKKIQKHINI